MEIFASVKIFRNISPKAKLITCAAGAIITHNFREAKISLFSAGEHILIIYNTIFALIFQ
jgi:hypothetical protein